MQPPFQTFPVLSFLGVVVQLGGALMLIALFVMLRRFVAQRAYFAAWTYAWGALAVAIFALVIRYILVPGIVGFLPDETYPGVRALYLVYQTSKVFGFIYFVRGTLTYVSGETVGLSATRRLWIGGAVFAAISTFAATQQGLNEMVIWQAFVAVPALSFCAVKMLVLPPPRRTTGNRLTGFAFSLLAALWLGYAVVFTMLVRDVSGPIADRLTYLIGFNSYFDLTLNIVLGYAMLRVLMEDAKREMDDAQAELHLTHDRLRRAALYDSLTETLNRRAFSEGVGLEMARATFGAVVIADLDNLKMANDRFGHAAGDQLIRRCSDVLRDALGRNDKLYRWGGDEFLIVLPSARIGDVLDRLHAAIAAAAPIVSGAGGERLQLRVSLGAAEYQSSQELEAAIERADSSMYEDKGRRKSDPEYTLRVSSPLFDVSTRVAR
jgi:diguanylate cyclase (GGDEF)-like protein